jgi:hypothetical protein
VNGPQLALSPTSGPLAAQITIDGAGFPVDTRVRIQLSAPNTTQAAQFIGEVLTNGAGQFKLIFIIPDAWSDGTPITAPKLVFTGLTLNGDSSASAEYTNTSGVAAANTAQVQPTQADPTSSPPTDPPAPNARPAITLDPASGGANTQVNAQVSGFPADAHLVIRLGVPGAGAGPQVYAETVTGADGSGTVAFAMPATWPDGRAISEPDVMVLALTDDGAFRALAQFSFNPDAVVTTVPAPTDAPTELPTEVPADAATATPVDAPTDVAATVEPTAAVDATAPAPDQTQEPAPTVSVIVDGPGPATPDPIQASIDFLYSLLRDPSGTSSVPFLSQRLRAEISANWVLPTGLGIQPGYNAFEVVVISRDDATTVLQATLTYESGASMRTLTLIKEGENWRIDKVVAG